MILASFFTTVEFYIITAFIAAAVIAAASMPSNRGATRTFLFACTLRDDAAPSDPGIVAEVNDKGELELHRFGLTGVDMATGACSLAVTVIGFDVSVEERLVPGKGSSGSEATAAYATLDCFGQERYHFNYRSEAMGRSAAFSLNIKPGNRIERLLL